MSSTTKNVGPVPVGNYHVLVTREIRPAQPRADVACGFKPGWGLETIFRGGPCESTFANWGNNRVRFLPADDRTRHACASERDGLYLHDSTKGYSHGCIEVEVTFFYRLQIYRLVAVTSRLALRVDYKHASTNGGTAA